MRRQWRLFLAWTRISLPAVCELSRDRGEWDDFHDWADGELGAPLHFFQHTCKRCGKRFQI